MKLHPSVHRLVSVSAASALALGGLVAAASAPASAAAPISYSCTVTVGALTPQSGEMPVVISTNLPATLKAGQTVTPTITADVSLPDDARAGLYNVGFRTGSGTVSAALSVNGAARTQPLGIPATEIPATTGAFTPRATGSVGVVTAGAAGSQVAIDVTGFTANLGLAPTILGYNAATLTCALPAGRSGRVATASVVAAPAPVVKKAPKVSVKLAKAKVKRGKTATVKVAVSAAGAVPSGRVTVAIGSVRKAVTLKSGRATVKVKVARKTKPGTVKVTVGYAGDARVKAGRGVARLKVTK